MVPRSLYLWVNILQTIYPYVTISAAGNEDTHSDCRAGAIVPVVMLGGLRLRFQPRNNVDRLDNDQDGIACESLP